MRNKAIAIAAASIFMFPVLAMAQGVVRGADEGAREGNRAAGPVGGVVGGVLGAVGGGIAGVLGVDQGPRFREYVVREHRNSYTYDRPVVVGSELPGDGVTYYEAPEEYGIHDYRYTVVNGRTVLVDPRTHRIVQVIE